MKGQGFQKQKMLGWVLKEGREENSQDYVCDFYRGKQGKRKSLRLAHWDSIELWDQIRENCDIMLKEGGRWSWKTENGKKLKS